MHKPKFVRENSLRLLYTTALPNSGQKPGPSANYDRINALVIKSILLFQRTTEGR